MVSHERRPLRYEHAIDHPLGRKTTVLARVKNSAFYCTLRPLVAHRPPPPRTTRPFQNSKNCVFFPFSNTHRPHRTWRVLPPKPADFEFLKCLLTVTTRCTRRSLPVLHHQLAQFPISQARLRFMGKFGFGRKTAPTKWAVFSFISAAPNRPPHDWEGLRKGGMDQ